MSLITLGPRVWKWPSALSALSHPNFRLFWAGFLLTLIGTWMQRTAQQWLVFRLTGSSLSLGLVTFANFIPMLFLTPIAGVVVDRVNKRRFVLLTEVAFLVLGALQAVLTLTGLIDYTQLVVLAALLGTVEAFEVPARQAFVVETVGREDLPNAIALNVSNFQAARVVGPAIAGIVIAQVGEGVAFALNSVGFLGVIGSLVLMRLPAVAPRRLTRSAMQDLREGIAFVRRRRLVLGLLGLVGMQGLFGSAYYFLMPVFAERVLNSGVTGLGLMLSAGGVGALVGAATLVAASHSRRKGLVVTAGSLVFTVFTACFAVSQSMPLSLASLAVVGWAQVVHVAGTNMVLQEYSPDALRGRVLSLHFWIHGGLLPFCALGFGALAEGVGVSAAVLAGTLVFGAAAVGAAWRLPEIRDYGREPTCAKGATGV